MIQSTWNVQNRQIYREKVDKWSPEAENGLESQQEDQEVLLRGTRFPCGVMKMF